MPGLRALSLSLPLMLGGASPMTPPDVIRAGEVMATLNDWRAILLVALVLCALMFCGLIWVVAMTFRIIGKTAEATAAHAQALQAVNITLSRIESESGR